MKEMRASAPSGAHDLTASPPGPHPVLGIAWTKETYIQTKETYSDAEDVAHLIVALGLAVDPLSRSDRARLY